MSLLASFFIKDEVSDSLFDIRGALDSFSKCTDVAYCLGFFPKAVYQNLKIIGKIRNAFAHSTTVHDFTTPEIAGLCSQLRLSDIQETLKAHDGEKFVPLSPEELHEYRQEEMNTAPRQRFVSMGNLLLSCHR